MTPELISIKSTYFVAGVTLQSDVVCQAAPILKYMKGWSREQVMNYATKKGWTVQTVASSCPTCED
jgi:hypothetical protein